VAIISIVQNPETLQENIAEALGKRYSPSLRSHKAAPGLGGGFLFLTAKAQRARRKGVETIVLPQGRDFW